MEVDYTDVPDMDGSNFIKGKRYALVVEKGQEGFSKTKGTPYIKIFFKTVDGKNALDKTLWITPEALPFSREWFVAFGFTPEGKFNFPTERIEGIRLTAEAGDRANVNDSLKPYFDWVKPLAVVIGAPAAAPAADTRQAPAASKPAPTSAPAANTAPADFDPMDGDVPF